MRDIADASVYEGKFVSVMFEYFSHFWLTGVNVFELQPKTFNNHIIHVVLLQVNIFCTLIFLKNLSNKVPSEINYICQTSQSY